MAPEVIMTEDSDDVYTTKADIWSIGITAIEIAEKNPPLSDIHPMRALKMIPSSDLGLAKPKNFSKPFVDFVNSCLIKDPNQRPSAAVLLNHAFLKMGAELPRQELIKQMVDKVMYIKEKKKEGIEVTEDDQEALQAQSNVPQKLVSETMKLASTLRANPSYIPEISFASTSGAFSFFVIYTYFRALIINPLILGCSISASSPRW